MFQIRQLNVVDRLASEQPNLRGEERMYSRQVLAHSKFLLVLLALLLFTPSACKSDNDAVTPIDELAPDPSLPPAVVDLPPAPPASAFVIPDKNADGSLRVQGLIKDQADYLDKPVELSAMVFSISEPCDVKKAKKEGKECQEPHFLIKDERDAEKQLMVVGYKDDFIKKSKLTVGEQRVFKGVYQKMAYGFIASEDGLLLLDAVDDIEVVAAKK